MKLKIQHQMIILLLIASNFSAANAATDVDIPFKFGQGQALYEQRCSSCHGLSLSGTEKGPPLIHAYYKPSHHGDGAFYNAALKGARAHHWDFGDMPPVEGITKKELGNIIPFIRYYQKQKGLY
ncbi:MAG: cytochrome c2 [Gammaproteobacteria bacterium]|jgi:cytochrome c2